MQHQIGYRHIVPAVTLVSIFAALELGRLHSWRKDDRVAIGSRRSCGRLVLTAQKYLPPISTRQRRGHLPGISWTPTMIESRRARHLESELRGAIRIPDTQPLFFCAVHRGRGHGGWSGATELPAFGPVKCACACTSRISTRAADRGYEVLIWGRRTFLPRCSKGSPSFAMWARSCIV